MHLIVSSAEVSIGFLCHCGRLFCTTGKIRHNKHKKRQVGYSRVVDSSNMNFSNLLNVHFP
jgi:hypothetical protein